MRKTHRIVWSPAAITDLDAIADYIAHRDGGRRAASIYSRIIASVGKLKRQPSRCRVVPELGDLGITVYRELILAPYRVVFRINGSRVDVVAVIDGRRDLRDVFLRRISDTRI